MKDVIVGGLIEKDGKFLLVQEAKKKCYGKWNIPAGHLESNETIFDGVKREIKEETGCDVSLKGLLQVSNGKLNGVNWIGIIFLVQLVNENIKFNVEEILDVKWFTYEEIKKLELRENEFILSVIENYINNNVVSIDIVKILEEK